MKYLDTNVLGYALERHEKYGSACKRILQDIQDLKLEVCCSILVLSELLGVLAKINKALVKMDKPALNVRANIEAVLSLPITWVELTPFVITHAAGYSYSVPGADLIHFASMELENVHEIISADSDFDRFSGIRRIDPLEY
ncbi:MAG TPA: type II toxin-antitoxin system VapC family toxin [Candidatus Nanoarchaeia archaeon]|nr:type II toxin-antitoxin system VapC family toxin [Candidatus Nanoarchaeia archaeon]